MPRQRVCFCIATKQSWRNSRDTSNANRRKHVVSWANMKVSSGKHPTTGTTDQQQYAASPPRRIPAFQSPAPAARPPSHRPPASRLRVVISLLVSSCDQSHPARARRRTQPTSAGYAADALCGAGGTISISTRAHRSAWWSRSRGLGNRNTVRNTLSFCEHYRKHRPRNLCFSELELCRVTRLDVSVHGKRGFTRSKRVAPPGTPPKRRRLPPPPGSVCIEVLDL